MRSLIRLLAAAAVAPAPQPARRWHSLPQPVPPPGRRRQQQPRRQPPVFVERDPRQADTASSAPCRAASRRWWRRRFSQLGQPNGYILGEEAGGAFVAGLRYGEGTLYTKNAGDLRVFWQGPSIGFDAGGEGARTMMLVYNLPATDAIYRALRRRRRLGLFHRRLRHDRADRR